MEEMAIVTEEVRNKLPTSYENHQPIKALKKSNKNYWQLTTQEVDSLCANQEKRIQLRMNERKDVENKQKESRNERRTEWKWKHNRIKKRE